jgi:hypothetical protein
MSVPLTVGGVTFNYPQQFDRNWGPTLTGWSTAVTNALSPLAGGFLTLAPFPSTGINFANATNTGFLGLTVNGSNQLTFNGVPIAASSSLTNGHIFVGDVSNQPGDVAMTGDVAISNTGVTTLGALKVSNSNIATLAGIAFTKLASTTPYFWYVADSGGVLSPIGVTASRVVITDANGLPSASSVTPTELSYLSGATSSIQTQLTSITGSFLPLSGGTMSGPISMASNKITALANGTASGDAVNFGQLSTIQAQIAYFQLVKDGTLTATTTSGTSFVDMNGLSVTITPSSVSHRIKISVSAPTQAVVNHPGVATVSRNGSGVQGSSGLGVWGSPDSMVSFVFVDSPASTSALTYHIQFRSTDGTSVSIGSTSTVTSLICEEIV